MVLGVPIFKCLSIGSFKTINSPFLNIKLMVLGVPIFKYVTISGILLCC